MAIDLSLPVLKFSHVNNLETADKEKWTHTAAPDMFVLLKGSDADGRMTMHIVSGTSTIVSSISFITSEDSSDQWTGND